jgi:hypothetical protein
MESLEYCTCPLCGDEFVVRTVIFRRSRTFLLCPRCGCIEMDPAGEEPRHPALAFGDAAT